MCEHLTGKVPGDVHPVPTARSGLCYFFSVKHHRPKNTGDAQWALPEVEEFAVFDRADRFHLACDRGHLYGVIPGRRLGHLGTRREQVAKFPKPTVGTPAWHGCPYWPILQKRGEGGRTYPIPSEALDRMAAAGLITATQRKRLLNGDHA